jgi:riboflavin synthase
MFTGLVEELGTVEEAIVRGGRKTGQSMRLAIKAPLVGKDAEIGDSIAVNGCCLTVVKKTKNQLEFDAGAETLSRTNLERLKSGSGVNLERSLRVGDRLGGHLVSGHIDGTGTLLKRRDEEDWSFVTFRASALLMRQVVNKGSIAVDGVSLTVVTAESDRFSVALIPHTLAHTTLGKLEVGGVVNLETDLLAKYVERQLESRRPESSLLPAFG